jgi:hypothetical protein
MQKNIKWMIQVCNDTITQIQCDRTIPKQVAHSCSEVMGDELL